MIMLSDCWAVSFRESLTCTAKLKVPACVGVPAIWKLQEDVHVALGFTCPVRPGGSAPTVHWYPALLPPEAKRYWLYGMPTVPEGSVEGVMFRGVVTTARLKVALPVRPVESVAVMVMGKVPA
jgi:hypothetical protein